jgi:hypothetical protein
MKRFVEGDDRHQVTLLPECLDDFIDEDNPVRVIDAFVDELDLQTLGFLGMEPAATGRPSYHRPRLPTPRPRDGSTGLTSSTSPGTTSTCVRQGNVRSTGSRAKRTACSCGATGAAHVPRAR